MRRKQQWLHNYGVVTAAAQEVAAVVATNEKEAAVAADGVVAAAAQEVAAAVTEDEEEAAVAS